MEIARIFPASKIFSPFSITLEKSVKNLAIDETLTRHFHHIITSPDKKKKTDAQNSYNITLNVNVFSAPLLSPKIV